MTAIHDLTQSSEARLERRIKALEQAMVANQQSGVGVKWIAQGSEATPPESLITLPNMEVKTWAPGQYFVGHYNDAEMTVSGSGIINIVANGVLQTQAIINGTGRNPMSSMIANYFDAGVTLQVQAKRIGGTFRVYTGSFVVIRLG